MLTPNHPRRRHRRLVTAAAGLMAAVLLMPASVALAMDAGSVEHEPPTTDLGLTQAEFDELRAIVDDLSSANDELRANNSSLQQTVDALELERDRLVSSLDQFGQLYDPLEADRQLVLELRKGLPETRPEVEAQLARIRGLALASDPARLGQLIDRVDDAAPAFLDWRFGEFDTTEAFTSAYVETGANAFESTMEEFRSEVLMSVATRLDGLLTILDRVR